MKKIFAIIFLGIFISCDLEREPYDSYTDNIILSDPEANIQILLNGCYAELKFWSEEMLKIGEYPGDNIAPISTLSSWGFSQYYSYLRDPFNTQSWIYWDSSFKIISQTSNLIKIIPENENENLDQQLGELYYMRGMMYFYLCRDFGFSYSQSPSTNLGIPIVNGIPSDIDNLILPDRATVEKTYEQAINDLKKAEMLMTIKKDASYATKAAAQALLSRVYLYMSGTYESPNQQYAQLSIDYANKVIGSGDYELLSRDAFMKYNTFAPDASGQTEAIFAVKKVDSDYSGSAYLLSIGGWYSVNLGTGLGYIYASDKYLKLLNKGGYKKDARWAFIAPQYQVDASGNKIPAFRFAYDLYNAANTQIGYNYLQAKIEYNPDNSLYIMDGGTKYDLTLTDANTNSYSINYNGKTYIGEMDNLMVLAFAKYPRFYVIKCSGQDNISQLHSPTISRLSEMYLNMAEAYAKIGNYGMARTNLNRIRERSIIGGGYTSLDNTNAQQLIDEERQLELAFEGHRGYDVYRNGFTMERRYPGAHNAMLDYAASNPLILHYIPQYEIDAYPGTLTQN